MSVKLRLARVGKTKQPHYRVVAADTRKARNGEFLDIVGQYRPLENPSGFVVDPAKVMHWLKNGALPTERVRKLLEINGMWAEFMATKSNAKKK
ncbi:MAG: 30S ribosomal protein S16 [Ilumatobacteraceae bacterium]|jgi:small subunit ribosomal protein S16